MHFLEHIRSLSSNLSSGLSSAGAHSSSNLDVRRREGGGGGRTDSMQNNSPPFYCSGNPLVKAVRMKVSPGKKRLVVQ